MKELLSHNIEKETETSIELEVSVFLLKEDKKLNDGDIVSNSSEIVLLSKENDDFFGLTGYQSSSKKIVFLKCDEVNFFEEKKILFEISELKAIKKIFIGDIF